MESQDVIKCTLYLACYMEYERNSSCRIVFEQWTGAPSSNELDSLYSGLNLILG
jgi:hypothetical protein